MAGPVVLIQALPPQTIAPLDPCVPRAINYRMPHPSLRLTPHGHLILEEAADAPELDERTASRLSVAFARGGGHGLLQLAAGEAGHPLPSLLAWWRTFATPYIAALCLQPTTPDGALPEIPPPTEAELAALVLTAPMMAGAEYLTQNVLRSLWRETAAALATSLTAAKTDLQSFLKALNPAWNLVGRVHFNLAENRRDDGAPFAFLATYTTRLSAQARAQHVPLGQALREYAGPANRQKLLALLLPVQRAAETCAWLRPMVDEGEIYHPLRWTPGEAARLLTSVPDLERAGVMVRMPPSWRANRPPRPKVTGTVGARKPSALGLEGVLDFQMDVTLDGETLTEQEIATLLSGTDSLVLLRGQWVEVDRATAGALDRPVPRSRTTGGARRPQLRRGHADGGGRRGRGRTGGRRNSRLVAGDRRPLAGGNAAKPARTERQCHRAGPSAARRAAAVSARRDCTGCNCCRASASAPAWPTTWDWARPSRCWRC